MGSLSSPGIGSGLNVNQLVSQLVAAERAPQERRIARLETEARADLTAFNQVRAALSALQSAAVSLDGEGARLGRRATVGADAGFAAQATSAAVPGRYAIEVAALATAQKRQSAPLSDSADLGTGTVAFTVGSDTFNVTLGPTTTLAQLRDAINAATGGRGLSATIVRGDAGSVLVLNAATAGSAGAISVAASGSIADVLGSAGAGIPATTPAADAVVRVDGVTRTASSNRLTDLIGGVTLDLTRATPGATASLEIGTDAGPLRSGVQTFINAYNVALSTLRTVSAVNPTTGSAAALAGDSAVRGLQQQLRGLVGSAFGELSALGIRSSKDGSLTLDAARFDQALAANPAAVAALFDRAASASLGARLSSQLGGAVAPNTGLIDGRTRSLDDRLRGIATERERLDARIARVEEGYRRQFTALDGLVAQLQSTQSFLTRELARLPGAS